MEERFGEDFGHVRVHTDARAADSAEAVAARAYTVGRDVVFGAGRYAPETGEGQRLLAHELAHVVQQGRGGGTPSLARDSLTEQSALQAAEHVSQSSSRLVQVTGASGVGLARQENPGTTNTSAHQHRFSVDGKTITLNEEEYKRERARTIHTLGNDFTLIEETAAVYAQNHRDFLNKTHGFWGTVSDIVANTAPPTLIIWTWPRAAIQNGREALQSGNLVVAARHLQLAQQAFKDSVREWNTYIEKTTGGAQKTATFLEFTRDISFAIAIGSAAVVFAPLIAGGLTATAGAAGLSTTAAATTSTLGTGLAVTGGGATAGAGLRAGSAVLGQALAGDKISGKKVREEAIAGGKRGAVDAASAVVGFGAGRALRVGAQGSRVGTEILKGGLSGAAGGSVGGGLEAALEDKPANEDQIGEDKPANEDQIGNQGKPSKPTRILKGALKGAALGALGGAVGAGAGKLLGTRTVGTRFVGGFIGGGIAGAAGAALEGGDIKTGLLTGGIAGGVQASADHHGTSQKEPSKRRMNLTRGRSNVELTDQEMIAFLKTSEQHSVVQILKSAFQTMKTNPSHLALFEHINQLQQLTNTRLRAVERLPQSITSATIPESRSTFPGDPYVQSERRNQASWRLEGEQHVLLYEQSLLLERPNIRRGLLRELNHEYSIYAMGGRENLHRLQGANPDFHAGRLLEFMTVHNLSAEQIIDIVRGRRQPPPEPPD
jgi:hypothetical protein